MLASAPPPVARRPWYRPNLTQQILLGLVIGILLGIVEPAWAVRTDLVRDLFLKLIKAMIAPLVFGSVVQGIAGTGDLRKVGRVGGKALLYFEIVTTAALAVGLLAVNVIRPGAGVKLAAASASLVAAPTAKPLTLPETILHIFPTSIFDALARNDVLQVVAFAVIFAIGLIAAGEAGAPVLAFCGSLTQVMFKFAGLVMLLAPYGVGAAIAVTVGQQGPTVLLSLAKLVLTLYGALATFIVIVLGTVIHLTRIPLRPFVRAVREPFIIAFATANSEAALPKAFELMERFGVPRSIVAFVLPAGYTFNLDGTTLYLAIASVFVAQASEVVTGIHFGLMQQVTMMLTLMLTSKGVAAVPRASLVVLIAALQSFNLPLEGAAMILGVDALLDMARTSVNVLGNCLASVVVARWEGEFDEAKAHANFGPGTDAS
jgi:proton glutamate symport protein